MIALNKIAALAATVFFLSSCQKETQKETQIESDAVAAKNGIPAATLALGKESEEEPGANRVYSLSNQVSGNKVLEFARAANGVISYNTAYATGGTGTGGGLGNQGALILGEDNETLLAVNPGSNSISLFKISENGLSLKSTVGSGGTKPVSITMNHNLVYVLNAGGTGNISGFKMDDDMLISIPNSSRPLSSPAAGAAEIAFVNEGKVVVVTEKATNKIITYTIKESGVPAAMHSISSSTPTPFGFDAGRNGKIFVSEAAGGAPGASKLSSYQVNYDGSISLITGSVGANQSAACWIVITENGKYAYTTNTGSNNLSSFNINKNSGAINVNTPIASTTGAGPIDAALSSNSKNLYILNAGSHSISVYSVATNGNLTSIQLLPGLPVGATGLASK